MCCAARWWTGCVAGSLGLVPDALRSLPGHPRGGSVQPRSFPPACLQEMQDKGVALAGGRRVETGETLDRMMGGEGGHCGAEEVPRFSLEQQNVAFSGQECQVCMHCCSSMSGTPPASVFLP